MPLTPHLLFGTGHKLGQEIRSVIVVPVCICDESALGIRILKGSTEHQCLDVHTDGRCRFDESTKLAFPGTWAL